MFWSTQLDASRHLKEHLEEGCDLGEPTLLPTATHHFWPSGKKNLPGTSRRHPERDKDHLLNVRRCTATPKPLAESPNCLGCSRGTYRKMFSSARQGDWNPGAGNSILLSLSRSLAPFLPACMAPPSSPSLSLSLSLSLLSPSLHQYLVRCPWTG